MAAQSRLSSRAKAWLAGGVVLIGIVLLVAVAEVAVRARQYIKYGPMPSIDQMYEVDQRSGLRVPRAGADFGRIRINSQGFRSPELREPKQSEVFRIAFLGASTTFCAEVSSNEATWPSLVAGSLQSHFPHSSIEFINGGVPGYTLQSSLKNLEIRVAPLKPDLLVIYHGTNDLSGELRGIARAQMIGGNMEPPEASWLSRHSLLWDLASKNLRVLLARRDSESGDKRSISLDVARLGARFRDDLHELVRSSKKTGAIVALVTFSTHMRAGQTLPEQQDAMQSAILYMPGADFSTLVTAYGRYNEIIREVARLEGVLLVDREDSIPGNPEYFVDSVHFSDAGSRAQARRVLSALVASDAVRRMFKQAD